MNIEEVKQLPVEERLLYWIEERESIRKKKERNKPKPWTDDQILQQYKFCNVRRMDDRVSRWLLENWYKPYYDHPNMLIACVMARLFNNPEALEDIGFPEKKFNPDRIIRILHRRKRNGLKNFRAAYIVSTNGLEGDKVQIVVQRILVPASSVKLGKIGNTSLEALCGHLTGLWGISTFIAGQVSADVRQSVRGLWTDCRTWAPMGPGSQRGLKRLRGLNPKGGGSFKPHEFLTGLREVIKTVDKRIPRLKKKLEAIDYQNCLCEFDKYERTLWGEGRPKQIYPGVK